MSEKAKLTPKKRKAILAFMDGANIEGAAEQAGVTTKTISRWLREDGFTVELRKSQAQVLNAVGVRLVALSGKALNALETVMDHPGMKGANTKRLAAANILDLVYKWLQLVEFDARLARLEEQVNYGK